MVEVAVDVAATCPVPRNPTGGATRRRPYVSRPVVTTTRTRNSVGKDRSKRGEDGKRGKGQRGQGRRDLLSERDPWNVRVGLTPTPRVLGQPTDSGLRVSGPPPGCVGRKPRSVPSSQSFRAKKRKSRVA